MIKDSKTDIWKKKNWSSLDSHCHVRIISNPFKMIFLRVKHVEEKAFVTPKKIIHSFYALALALA